MAPTTQQNTMAPGAWTVGGSLTVTGTLAVSGNFVRSGMPDSATITLAAPVSTARAVSVQLLDGAGANIASVQQVTLHVFADAAGAAYATTGGSTGIADAGAGSILAVVAKKILRANSSAAGLIELSWTDTASEVAFLGVELPSGRMVISAALTI